MDRRTLDKIRRDFIRGLTQKELSLKYKVPASTISKYCKREQWVKLREATEIERNKLICKSVAQGDVDRVGRVKLVADLILDQIEHGLRTGLMTGDAASIRALTTALKEVAAVHGVKTGLDEAEQIARIEKLKRDAAPDANDQTIRVIIGGAAPTDDLSDLAE